MRKATVQVEVEYPVVVREWVEVEVEYDDENGELEPDQDAILEKAKDEIDPFTSRVSLQDFERDSLRLTDYDISDFGE
jgi:hypothetical protein